MITAPCHHSVLLLLAFFLHAQEKGRKRRAPLKRRGGCFSANCPWGGSESFCPASAWGFTRRRRWTETRGKAPSPGPEGGGGETFSLAPGNSSGILKQLLTHFLTLFRMWVYFNTVPGLTACCTAHLE